MLALRAVVGIVCLSAASTANAAILTYSNTYTGGAENTYNADYTAIRSLWTGLAGSLTNVTFEDASVPMYGFNSALLYSSGVYSPVDPCPTLASGEACFRTMNTTNVSYSVGSQSGSAGLPVGNYFSSLWDTSAFLQINLPTNATDFALDLHMAGPPNGPATVRIYDSSNTLIGTYAVPTTGNTWSAANSTPAFLGVRADVPIASIQVQIAGGTLFVGQLNYAAGGTPPPEGDVPESATLAYVACGLLAIVLGNARRRSAFRGWWRAASVHG